MTYRHFDGIAYRNTYIQTQNISENSGKVLKGDKDTG